MLVCPNLVACAQGSSSGGGLAGTGNVPGGGGIGTGGVGAGGSGGVGGGGTGGDGGGGTSGSGGNLTSTGRGQVLVYDYQTTGFVSASFRPAGSQQRISAGECEQLKTTDLAFSNAGTIVVSWDDPLSGPLTETMYPDTNDPDIYTMQVSSFPHGVPITVTASGSGGEVPAFTAVVTIPESNLALVSPVDGQSISLSTPLDLEWAGATGNTVVAEFGTTPEDTIRCEFGGGPVTGSIPVALLSLLPTEDPVGIPYGDGSLRLEDSDSVNLDLPDWQITVGAVGHAIAKDTFPIAP